MPSPNLNSPYITYELTEEDTLRAAMFTPEHRALLQNLKMETVEQKLQLTAPDLTEAGKETYWQQEAYLRGQLDILDHLITMADIASQQLELRI